MLRCSIIIGEQRPPALDPDALPRAYPLTSMVEVGALLRIE
jgi:hypothetical protein